MRRTLLDTCTLLWWLSNDHRLGLCAKEVVADANNQIFVSAATPWEIGIKRVLGKLRAPANIESILDETGFEKLSISCFHGESAAQLPLYHKDPFDRIIIAQAQAEGLEVMTADDNFNQYGIRLIDACL